MAGLLQTHPDLQRLQTSAYRDSCELSSPPWYGWFTMLNQGSVPVNHNATQDHNHSVSKNHSPSFPLGPSDPTY